MYTYMNVFFKIVLMLPLKKLFVCFFLSFFDLACKFVARRVLAASKNSSKFYQRISVLIFSAW